MKKLCCASNHLRWDGNVVGVDPNGNGILRVMVSSW